MGALASLGITHLAQNQLAEAIACLQQAATLDPQVAEVHNNLGIALRKQRKLEEAAACYARALALMPDFAEAHNNLGVAQQLFGQGKAGGSRRLLSAGAGAQA